MSGLTANQFASSFGSQLACESAQDMQLCLGSEFAIQHDRSHKQTDTCKCCRGWRIQESIIDNFWEWYVLTRIRYLLQTMSSLLRQGLPMSLVAARDISERSWLHHPMCGWRIQLLEQESRL